MTKASWPSDALIIIAPRTGTEKREQHRGAPVAVSCRNCAARCIADSFTVQQAAEMPQRGTRAIEVLCIECCVLYDRATINELHDLTPGHHILGQSVVKSP